MPSGPVDPLLESRAEELASHPRRLCDGTCLKILALLAQRPQSTRELAQLLDLPSELLEDSIAALRAAGCVVSSPGPELESELRFRVAHEKLSALSTRRLAQEDSAPKENDETGSSSSGLPVVNGAGGENATHSFGLLCDMVAHAADPAFIVDAQQQIVLLNKAAERLLGRVEGEVTGRPCFAVFAGKDRRGAPFCRSNCPILKATKRGHPVPSVVLTFLTPKQEQVWLNVTVLLATEQGNCSFHLVHLLRDETQEKKRLELLDQILSQTRALLTPETIDIPRPLPLDSLPSGLTRREYEVLKFLAEGKDTQEIAEMLTLSVWTVRNHIEAVLEKLGVHDRLEAVVYGYRQGWF